MRNSKSKMAARGSQICRWGLIRGLLKDGCSHQLSKNKFFYLSTPSMMKVDNGGNKKTGLGNNQIMTKREATNGVASQLPERRMTAMPTTCVKRKIPHTGCPKKHAPVGFGTSQTSFFFSLFSHFFLRRDGTKNLFCKSCSECPKTQAQTPIQTPSAILGPPGNHIGFSRQCGVAPLCWYSTFFIFFSSS